MTKHANRPCFIASSLFSPLLSILFSLIKHPYLVICTEFIPPCTLSMVRSFSHSRDMFVPMLGSLYIGEYKFQVY